MNDAAWPRNILQQQDMKTAGARTRPLVDLEIFTGAGFWSRVVPYGKQIVVFIVEKSEYKPPIVDMVCFDFDPSDGVFGKVFRPMQMANIKRSIVLNPNCKRIICSGRQAPLNRLAISLSD